MNWIEKHTGKILFFFLIVFAIEGAIWCWRQPKEFRSATIPKIEYILSENYRMQKLLKELKTYSGHTHRYYDGKIQGTDN